MIFDLGLHKKMAAQTFRLKGLRGRLRPIMTTFDDRENAYEAKFAHDQELHFKAKARRDKRFGAWVAAQLGLSGAAAEDYAKGLMRADLAHPGDSAILEAVLRDLKAKGVAPDERKLKVKLLDLMEEAIAEIEAGK
jgi:hypothetical protein